MSSKELKEVSSKQEYRTAIIKYVVIGDSSVGKTNMLLRYTENSFSSTSESTLGVDHKKKTYFYENIKVKEQIWDTAGSEKYQSVAGVYFKNCHGALVVYDISNKESFDNLKKWIFLLKQQTEDVQILVVGNKIDLEHKRSVSYDDAKDFAEREGKTLMIF